MATKKKLPTNKKKSQRQNLEESVQYEKLVRDIYDALENQAAINTVSVQHDVTLRGKSGATHQIDVYWVFDVGGQQYRCCVECRHYDSAIKKSHVAAFSRILQDLDANGIMVTTKDFQKGGRQIAAYDGIRLVRVNHIIRKMSLELTLISDRVVDIVPEIDQDSANVLCAKFPGEDIQVTFSGYADQLFLLNPDGTHAISILDLQKRVIASKAPAGPHIETSVAGLYIPTTHGPIKIRSVACKVIRNRSKMSAIIHDGEGIARAVVEDLRQKGPKQFFHADGTLTLEVSK